MHLQGELETDYLSSESSIKYSFPVWYCRRVLMQWKTEIHSKVKYHLETFLRPCLQKQKKVLEFCYTNRPSTAALEHSGYTGVELFLYLDSSFYWCFCYGAFLKNFSPLPAPAMFWMPRSANGALPASLISTGSWVMRTLGMLPQCPSHLRAMMPWSSFITTLHYFPSPVMCPWAQNGFPKVGTFSDMDVALPTSLVMPRSLFWSVSFLAVWAPLLFLLRVMGGKPSEQGQVSGSLLTSHVHNPFLSHALWHNCWQFWIFSLGEKQVMEKWDRVESKRSSRQFCHHRASPGLPKSFLMDVCCIGPQTSPHIEAV